MCADMTDLLDYMSVTDTLDETLGQDLLAEAQTHSISSLDINNIENLSYRLGIAPLALAKTLNQHILNEKPEVTSATLDKFTAQGFNVSDLMSATLVRFDTSTKSMTLEGKAVEVTLFNLPATKPEPVQKTLLETASEGLDQWFPIFNEIKILSRTFLQELTKKYPDKNFVLTDIEKALAEAIQKEQIELPKIRHQEGQAYRDLFDHVNHMSKATRYAIIKQAGESLSEVKAYNAFHEITQSVEKHLLEKAEPKAKAEGLQVPSEVKNIAPTTSKLDKLLEQHLDLLDQALEKTQKSQFYALFKDNQQLLSVITPELKDAQEAAKPQLEKMKAPLNESKNPKTTGIFINSVAKTLMNKGFEKGLSENPLQMWEKVLNPKTPNEVFKSYTSKLVQSISDYVKTELNLPKNTAYKDLGIKKYAQHGRSGFVPSIEIQKLVNLAKASEWVPKDSAWKEVHESELEKQIVGVKEALNKQSDLTPAQKASELKKLNEKADDADIGLYALALLSDKRKLEAMLQKSALDYVSEERSKTQLK